MSANSEPVSPISHPAANPASQARELTKAEIEREVFMCALSSTYFINNYVHIFDAEAADFIPFKLWPGQIEVLDLLVNHRLVITLKPRQVGMTWLGLSFALWLMLFKPKQSILVFSRREEDAIALLAPERLRGMYSRLPKWMQARGITIDNAHQFGLSNGSIIRAFPTNGGDSYTATFVMVDEADLIPDFNKLMRAVKPTIDAAGRMFVLSRVNKSEPNSEFKKLYNGAKAGKTSWKHIFLPWYVAPGRTQAWYEEIKNENLERTGSMDEVWEQYPATDAEALAPKSKDKRLVAAWLLQCLEQHVKPMSSKQLLALDRRWQPVPTIPHVVIYAPPQMNRTYVLGGDPAEGNPNSDESAATMLDRVSGEEVAMFAGLWEPEVFGLYIDMLCGWYNKAGALIERNNHGHAVLLWLKGNGKRTKILLGTDKKPGWLTNTLGKTLLYTDAASDFNSSDTLIHSYETYTQLASIEASTLKAPEGDKDDRAMSYVLALMARSASAQSTGLRTGKAKW